LNLVSFAIATILSVSDRFGFAFYHRDLGKKILKKDRAGKPTLAKDISSRCPNGRKAILFVYYCRI
jgi:hypothetical protein